MPKPTMNQVILYVAQHFQLDPVAVVSPARDGILVDARCVITTICRDELKKSYPQIGRALNRDHATLIASYNRFNRLASTRVELMNARLAVLDIMLQKHGTGLRFFRTVSGDHNPLVFRSCRGKAA